MCNCDDPFASNFVRYFILNFETFGLKKLIATCYQSNDINLFTSNESEKSIYMVYTGTKDGNPIHSLDDVEITAEHLKGDGDYKSEECVALMNESDIVITNPPFSQMKEYLPFLLKHKKQFIILGNTNHITLKELTPVFLSEECWFGYTSGHFWFKVPSYYEPKKTDYKEDESGQKWRRMGNSCWFTNIDISRRHERLILYEKYTPEKYPKYDDYNAIECGRYAEIPQDYDGIVGVPVSYMTHHCPEQFEILRLITPKIGGKLKYKRLLIRKKAE